MDLQVSVLFDVNEVWENHIGDGCLHGGKGSGVDRRTGSELLVPSVRGTVWNLAGISSTSTVLVVSRAICAVTQED